MRLVRHLLLIVAALWALPVAAQTFPKFTGPVVDAANILPADREAALTASLTALQKDTGRQLVVATIPDLQGYTIEDYGYRLGRSWGVGDKDRDDGAILIVAPADRKVRIEIGYGLTPVMTDALSSIIVRNTVLPAFRAGDMPGGIVAGADAIVAQLRLPDNQAKARIDSARAAAERADQPSPIAIIFWVFVILVIIGALIASRFGSKRRRYAGRSNVWLWAPIVADIVSSAARSGGGGSSWGGGGGGFSGGGGGSFGGSGASGSW